jgi:hypothetical protein
VGHVSGWGASTSRIAAVGLCSMRAQKVVRGISPETVSARQKRLQVTCG